MTRATRPGPRPPGRASRARGRSAARANAARRRLLLHDGDECGAGPGASRSVPERRDVVAPESLDRRSRRRGGRNPPARPPPAQRPSPKSPTVLQQCLRLPRRIAGGARCVRSRGPAPAADAEDLVTLADAVAARHDPGPDGMMGRKTEKSWRVPQNPRLRRTAASIGRYSRRCSGRPLCQAIPIRQRRLRRIHRDARHRRSAAAAADAVNCRPPAAAARKCHHRRPAAIATASDRRRG
jgi:hypothetical protein